MDVVFSVGGQVVVDDQGDLLDVDASGQQVGGDEDSGRARAELAHDDVTLLLVHVAVLRRGRFSLGFFGNWRQVKRIRTTAKHTQGSTFDCYINMSA